MKDDYHEELAPASTALPPALTVSPQADGGLPFGKGQRTSAASGFQLQPHTWHTAVFFSSRVVLNRGRGCPRHCPHWLCATLNEGTTWWGTWRSTCHGVATLLVPRPSLAPAGGPNLGTCWGYAGMHELEMSGWSGFPTLVNDPQKLLQGLPPARIATVLSLPPLRGMPPLCGPPGSIEEAFSLSHIE